VCSRGKAVHVVDFWII